MQWSSTRVFNATRYHLSISARMGQNQKTLSFSRSLCSASIFILTRTPWEAHLGKLGNSLCPQRIFPSCYEVDLSRTTTGCMVAIHFLMRTETTGFYAKSPTSCAKKSSMDLIMVRKDRKSSNSYTSHSSRRWSQTTLANGDLLVLYIHKYVRMYVAPV